MLQPVVRRTWSPQGQTPVHNSWDRHDRLSAISALSVAPFYQRFGLYFHLQEENIRTPEVVAFIKSLQRHLHRHIIVILDRWSVHRAAVRKLIQSRAKWFQVEWLPAYAPELNPTEGVWDHTKYADLANFIPQDLEHLSAAVAASVATQRPDKSLLLSFFKHAQLELK
jgi:transposase